MNQTAPDLVAEALRKSDAGDPLTEEEKAALVERLRSREGPRGSVVWIVFAVLVFVLGSAVLLTL